jgi:hypothetical protein
LSQAMTSHHPSWENIRSALEGACVETASAARAQLTHELNQLLRRFRQYQAESDWASLLLDATSRFVEQAAVFVLKDGVLELLGQTNLLLADDLAFPVRSAAAFASAADSKDPVIALRTSGEVGEALSGSEPGARAHILPIVNGDRTVALLFAVYTGPVDSDALELITGIASIVLERRSNTSLHSQIAVAPAPLEKNGSFANVHAWPSAMSGLPSWADLAEDDRALHIRAQRFSRVSVAQMQLTRPEACRAGREQSNLYLFLKNEIDRARETFRTRFLTIPSMVDYLHLELVHTAAEDDEKKLGADYPGQLV